MAESRVEELRPNRAFPRMRRSKTPPQRQGLISGGATTGVPTSRSSSHGVTFAVTKAETSMDNCPTRVEGRSLTARAEASATADEHLDYQQSLNILNTNRSLTCLRNI